MGRGDRRRFSQRTPGGREARYGLTGVERNSRLSVDFDRYRRGLPEFRRVGTIVRRVSQTAYIRWDDDPENVDPVRESDVRYWLDSGRARLTGPDRQTILDAKKEG